MSQKIDRRKFIEVSGLGALLTALLAEELTFGNIRKFISPKMKEPETVQIGDYWLYGKMERGEYYYWDNPTSDSIVFLLLGGDASQNCVMIKENTSLDIIELFYNNCYSVITNKGKRQYAGVVDLSWGPDGAQKIVDPRYFSWLGDVCQWCKRKYNNKTVAFGHSAGGTAIADYITYFGIDTAVISSGLLEWNESPYPLFHSVDNASNGKADACALIYGTGDELKVQGKKYYERYNPAHKKRFYLIDTDHNIFANNGEVMDCFKDFLKV